MKMHLFLVNIFVFHPHCAVSSLKLLFQDCSGISGCYHIGITCQITGRYLWCSRFPVFLSLGKNFIADPGLHRTLLGDGVGSMAGALLGGCPNTTYGESVACVAITRNASVVTILATAILAMLVSFFSPFVAFVNSIPGCVMGGVCIALYGFIAVSGLKMIQQVDLGKDNNLFVVSTILVTGIGGLSLTFGKITITPVAVALILGILANQILKGRSANRD